MKNFVFRAAVALVHLPLLLGFEIASAKSAYLRYPDIHGDRVVFCAEGDLWSASDQGGAVRRLTSHPGSEYFPSFSPDGKWIAFTGEYDGNRDVYVLSAEGGEPRRLTWHPAGEEVLGFTPDGAQILFRSQREAPYDSSELFTVPAAGGDPVKLPLGWAERIDIDPKTGLWAFSRTSWERATWKRYRGGTAPDIWVGDPRKADFREVTRFDGINAFPMWHGDRIYFASDLGGTMNLWSMRADGSDRKRLTDFDGWDARWPAMGPDGRIVFTLGADLWVLDPVGGRTRKIEVDLPSDRVLTRVRYPEPDRTLEWLSLSPEADRVAVTTRGEIFSVAVKDGVTLPVTRGSGARERYASFDPEGKRLVYVTDASHEEEIRTLDAWGRGEPKVVKAPGASGWSFPPIFSPDGKRIAYADQTQSLYVLPADGGAPKLVDRSTQGEITEYAFSPDGRWLAYAKTLPTDYSSIFIYDTKDGKTTAVSTPTTSDDSPAWDPEGRYLYFVSERSTNPLLDSRDWQNVEAKNRKLYMVLLRKDVKNPMANVAGLPETEEEKKGKKKKEDKAKDEKSAKGKKEKEDEDGTHEPPEPVAIDLEGLAGRVVELPIDHGVYSDVRATADKVFYLSSPVRGFDESPDLFEEEDEPDATLMVFDLDKREAKEFLDGVSSFELASKADKMLVMRKRGELYVVGTDAPPEKDLDESEVSLRNVVIEMSPMEEWEQIYHEAWRHSRDFFWDPGMGGVDWKGVRDRYAALLPRIATRDDLRDLIGEMIGELGNSHTYVWGGDSGVKVSRWSSGLLGADLRREGSAYKIVRVLRGDAADQARAALDEPGVNVAEGEYILAVNQRTFTPGVPFESHLANLARKEVVLTVAPGPSRQGARETIVVPLSGGEEDRLRYHDWVRRNREYVAAKTGGKIGYLHLADMWKDGLIAFNTWFYPQLDREGMIIDVRWNHGGAVSQMIVERLRRKIVSFDRARNGGLATYPQRVLNGPFVVITNEFAGSDGDIFPAAVQIEGLAPVLGMRSWGGVVGIRGDKETVDGGFVTEPEFAWWDAKQGWGLENRGVVPDIEVQNLPQDLARGIDAQLERAIQEVMKLHTEKPPVKPKFGPARGRSRAAFGQEVDGGR